MLNCSKRYLLVSISSLGDLYEVKRYLRRRVQARNRARPQRVKADVKQELKDTKKDYDALKDKDKQGFDLEKLNNPYADTRILNGDPNTEVKRALLGIDIEVGEIVLADRLREKGEKIDLVIAHHPEGRAMASLYDVMDMQSGILSKYGVPINVAEDIMGKRINESRKRAYAR